MYLENYRRLTVMQIRYRVMYHLAYHSLFLFWTPSLVTIMVHVCSYDYAIIIHIPK